MKPVVDFLVSHRRSLTVFMVILFAAGIFFSLKLQINNSLSIWFPSEDKSYAEYEEFKKVYGNDESVIIALKSLKSFSEEGSSEKFLKTVARLDSVENLSSPVTHSSGVLNGYKSSMLLSPDSFSAMLLMNFDAADAEKSRALTVKTVKKILSESGYEYHIGGVSVIYDELNAITLNNVSVFFLISFALVFLLMFAVVRDIRPVIFALFVVTATVTLTLGAMSLANAKLNMITSMLPVLILIYSVSDVVYIYYMSSKKLDNKGLSLVLTPCFFTSFTTAVGYISLKSSAIPCMAELGVWGAAAVMIEYFVTSVVYLGLSSKLKADPKPLFFKTPDFSKHLFKRPVYILFAVAFIAATGYGMRYLKIDTLTIGFFKENNTVRKDSDWIEKEIGNYLPLEMLVGYTSETGLIDTLRALQNMVEKEMGLKSFSLPDFTVKALFSGSKQKYLDADSKSARITFLIPMSSAREIAKTAAEIKETIESGSSLSAKPSGYLPLYSGILSYLQDSQIKSFPLSFIMVFIVMFLLFGVKRGFQSILPNIVPVFFVLGFMGYAGIRLDAGTIIITPILLGIVVDDTIHFLYAEKRGEEEKTHTPIFVTSLLLTLGFLALSFSQLTTIIHFGILSSLSLFVAYLGDAIILPGLIGKKRL